MENKALDRIARSFEIALPEANTLHEYLNFLLFSKDTNIRQWSEDLSEQEFYVTEGGKPWLQIQDRDNAYETVLHFFNPGGEYLQVVEGNVSRGKWRLLDNTNKMIIEQGQNRSEMFELAFLSDTFFILRKHGGYAAGKKPNFLVLGHERVVARLEWRDYVELLFNSYRSQNEKFNNLIVFFIVLVVIVLLLSVLR